MVLTNPVITSIYFILMPIHEDGDTIVLYLTVSYKALSILTKESPIVYSWKISVFLLRLVTKNDEVAIVIDKRQEVIGDQSNLLKDM